MPIDPDELLAALHAPGTVHGVDGARTWDDHTRPLDTVAESGETATRKGNHPAPERDHPAENGEHRATDRNQPRSGRAGPWSDRAPAPSRRDRTEPDPGRDRIENPPAEATRIRFTDDGPALVEGPVELITPDGATIHSDRFLVAICLCKRSRTYPLCDTSHRRRRRSSGGDEGLRRD